MTSRLTEAPTGEGTDAQSGRLVPPGPPPGAPPGAPPGVPPGLKTSDICILLNFDMKGFLI